MGKESVGMTCLRKFIVNRVVTTTCGRTASMAETTPWESLCDCRYCLLRKPAPNEEADAFEALIAQANEQEQHR